jgi:hypothetical protein
MVASAEDRAAGQGTRSDSRQSRSSAGTLGSGPVAVTEDGPVGKVKMETGSALSAVAGLRTKGFMALVHADTPEKEKVSITLDKSLVEEIRTQFGGRALSASINELLYAALAQERLAELVDEMEQEAGPASPEAYERVLAQWFDEG